MASHPLFPLLLDIVHTLGVQDRQFASYEEHELGHLLAGAINVHPPLLLRNLFQLEWMIKNLREGIERARREGRLVKDEDSE